MLGDRSRLVRLLLLAATVLAVVAWPTRHSSAYAAASGGDDDDDDGGGGDDDGAKSGGGDDDAAAGDDDDDADADQPPVTAGGLYSNATYPVSAVERPLTLIEGMTEVKVALGTDMSEGNTFKGFTFGAGARYGLKDNQELQAAFLTTLDNFSGFALSAGYEGALNYDLVDFRAALVVAYNKTKNMDGSSSSSFSEGVDVGFPVKYRIKPQAAILAIRRLMTINFDAAPDLTPTIGGIFNPIPELGIILDAGITLKRFDTKRASAGTLEIPASVAVQYTVAPAVDIALQFSFPNLKPPTKTEVTMPDPMDATKTITTLVDIPAEMQQKFYTRRALFLYANLRF
jgi:hypothetical protein